MSNFTVPYTFVGGTKAKAEEVNANFSAIKDELNTKVEKNDNGAVVVGIATESTHAVNKGQAESMISTALESKANCNLSNLSQKGINRLSYVPYSVHSGNVDENGEADVLYVDFEGSANTLSFKVGDVLESQYDDLLCLFANGVEFTRNSIPDIACSNLADGTYNLFITNTGDCIPLANKIFRQKNRPQTTVETSWTQPTLSANGTMGGSFFCRKRY